VGGVRSESQSYYYVDTGLIAANVYLFAASTGLASWFHNCDRTALGRRLGLRGEQHVLFAQTVGYPARPVRATLPPVARRAGPSPRAPAKVRAAAGTMKR
jgi:hypothetical protein